MKTYLFTNHKNETFKVAPFYTRCAVDKSLIVYLKTEDLKHFETITVILHDSSELNQDCAYVDSSGVPGIDDFLIDNDIAFPSGYGTFANDTMYLEYQFDLDKLNKEA